MPTIHEFYDEDPRRRSSPEVDFGVMWIDSAPYPKHRVSWIEATGEVYAMNLTTSEIDLIGTLPTRGDVEAALDGWEHGPLNDKYLHWVRARVLNYEG